MNIQELNHWWTENMVKEEFVPKTYRELFASLKEDFGRKQIQILIGLRRTGKSTIIFQIIDRLIKENIPPSNIIYCSFDEPELQNKSFDDILKDFSGIMNINYKKEKIYLFIDEVQKSKNWADNIKLIYDNLKNIKIFLSGSASLNILSDAKKSLAGRSIYYELKPLNFKEFLSIKGVKVDISKLLLYKEVLEKEFKDFIFRPFPELVNEKDINFIKNYIRSAVIEPIILKDIPKEFNEADILLLERIVEIFLSNPGQYLNMDGLAKDLKRTKATLYKALFYLEFSFIIRRILNFRPSMKIASRKMSRIYAYHPCLCLPFNISQEKYSENLVFSEIETKFYWRDKEKEIDFLKDFKPVEVKYKSQIEKQDTKWIDYFLEKYGKKLSINQAYVITKDLEEKRENIKLIPLWKFCLFGLK
ncbi:ATP-binding protein [Candidatus Pacearchaeota archaeon]|nr:ATP-binding protein [Candidatus Pacearchaeota archaeon]